MHLRTPNSDPRALLEDGMRRLAAGGIPEPRADTEWLLAHVMGCRRFEVYTQAQGTMSLAKARRFHRLVQKRLKRRPLAYLLGEWEFFGLPFEVTPAVLIPRSETELVVETCLQLMGREGGLAPPVPPSLPPSQNSSKRRSCRSHLYSGSDPNRNLQAQPKGFTPPTPAPTPFSDSSSISLGETSNLPLLVVDVGTGCGNIAVALAKMVPEARVIAIDSSQAALAVAQRNIVRHGIADRVTLVHGNLLNGRLGAGQPSILPLRSGSIDLIVSNPPYVATAELGGVTPEVQQEPREALDGGREGLSVIRRLIPEAYRWLRPGGWLVCEIGASQKEAVLALVAQHPFVLWEVKPDLGGHPRVLLARTALKPLPPPGGKEPHD